MEGVTVVDHVLLRRLVSILRDRSTPHGLFRQTLDDAAMILAYEAMRGLRHDEYELQTPLEPARGTRLADEEALRPVGYYENIPSGVADAEVFVIDPMLATGGSSTQAIARMKREGAQRITFVCLVAAPEGVDALRSAHPEVPILTAALDRELESNDAWLAIVGRTREELEAGQISWRAITPPEWAAQDDQVTRKLGADGWVAPYEKEYIRPDGTRVPVLLSGATLDLN